MVFPHRVRRETPEPPPDWREVKLDFSQFHPLDHRIWTCKSPGGRRRHLEYWWLFKARGEVFRKTLCRIGVHDYTTTQWRLNTESPWQHGQVCINCMKDEE